MARRRCGPYSASLFGDLALTMSTMGAVITALSRPAAQPHPTAGIRPRYAAHRGCRDSMEMQLNPLSSVTAMRCKFESFVETRWSPSVSSTMMSPAGCGQLSYIWLRSLVSQSELA
jgi:hypothetical protein